MSSIFLGGGHLSWHAPGTHKGPVCFAKRRIKSATTDTSERSFRLHLCTAYCLKPGPKELGYRAVILVTVVAQPVFVLDNSVVSIDPTAGSLVGEVAEPQVPIEKICHQYLHVSSILR